MSYLLNLLTNHSLNYFCSTSMAQDFENSPVCELRVQTVMVAIPVLGVLGILYFGKKLKRKFKELGTEVVLLGRALCAKDPAERTGVMHAALTSRSRLARVLIKAGADLESEDRRGLTSLMYTTFSDSSKVAQVLIKAKADLEHQTLKRINNTRGETALLLAAKNGAMKVLKLLVESKVNINHKDEHGKNSLMQGVLLRFSSKEDGHVVKKANSLVVKTLIKAGANLDLQDQEGFTALMMAIQKKYNEAAKVLLEAGASLDLQNQKGLTALMIAVTNSNPKMVYLLIEAGANIAIQDKKQLTVRDYEGQLGERMNGVVGRSLHKLDIRRQLVKRILGNYILKSKIPDYNVVNLVANFV